MTSFLLYDLQYSLFIQNSAKRSCAGGIEHRIMPGEMDMGGSCFCGGILVRFCCKGKKELYIKSQKKMGLTSNSIGYAI